MRLIKHKNVEETKKTTNQFVFDKNNILNERKCFKRRLENHGTSNTDSGQILKRIKNINEDKSSKKPKVEPINNSKKDQKCQKGEVQNFGNRYADKKIYFKDYQPLNIDEKSRLEIINNNAKSSGTDEKSINFINKKSDENFKNSKKTNNKIPVTSHIIINPILPSTDAISNISSLRFQEKNTPTKQSKDLKMSHENKTQDLSFDDKYLYNLDFSNVFNNPKIKDDYTNEKNNIFTILNQEQTSHIQKSSMSTSIQTESDDYSNLSNFLEDEELDEIFQNVGTPINQFDLDILMDDTEVEKNDDNNYERVFKTTSDKTFFNKNITIPIYNSLSTDTPRIDNSCSNFSNEENEMTNFDTFFENMEHEKEENCHKNINITDSDSKFKHLNETLISDFDLLLLDTDDNLTFKNQSSFVIDVNNNDTEQNNAINLDQNNPINLDQNLKPIKTKTSNLPLKNPKLIEKKQLESFKKSTSKAESESAKEFMETESNGKTFIEEISQSILSYENNIKELHSKNKIKKDIDCNFRKINSIKNDHNYLKNCFSPNKLSENKISERFEYFEDDQATIYDYKQSSAENLKVIEDVLLTESSLENKSAEFIETIEEMDNIDLYEQTNSIEVIKTIDHNPTTEFLIEYKPAEMLENIEDNLTAKFKLEKELAVTKNITNEKFRIEQLQNKTPVKKNYIKDDKIYSKNFDLKLSEEISKTTKQNLKVRKSIKSEHIQTKSTTKNSVLLIEPLNNDPVEFVDDFQPVNLVLKNKKVMKETPDKMNSLKIRIPKKISMQVLNSNHAKNLDLYKPSHEINKLKKKKYQKIVKKNFN